MPNDKGWLTVDEERALKEQQRTTKKAVQDPFVTIMLKTSDWERVLEVLADANDFEELIACIRRDLTVVEKARKALSR